jgi:hypothetical protein
MALFARRERPPASALARLDKEERVVAWADTSDDQVVVATSLGVWWPEVAGPRRVPWQHIDKVVWRENVLTLTEADVVDDALLVDRPSVSVSLAKPRDLPPVVRKRVEANIVRSELLSVGGGAVRFVARRLPGRDGIAWWARIEPGTPQTERVRSAISARLSILRSEWDDEKR